MATTHAIIAAAVPVMAVVVAAEVVAMAASVAALPAASVVAATTGPSLRRHPLPTPTPQLTLRCWPDFAPPAPRNNNHEILFTNFKLTNL
jgi:hypothetical protein